MTDQIKKASATVVATLQGAIIGIGFIASTFAFTGVSYERRSWSLQGRLLEGAIAPNISRLRHTNLALSEPC
jgi:hypothetical protein